MSLDGSHFDPHYRVDPAEYAAHDESEKEKKRRRSVLYQGHQWSESDEESLSEGVHLLETQQKEKEKPKKPRPLFVESGLLEKATELFDQLLNLEDKIAQLFFYKTEATYDPKVQADLTKMIMTHQLGGIIFLSGSYKRQAYLIEHYQNYAKIPLLVGNDFLHNLTFFDRKQLPGVAATTQHCRDLGKAVMGQNRSLGVHFLFDREEAHLSSCFVQDEEQKKSFRKGIRQAHGVVARDLLPEKAIHRVSSSLLRTKEEAIMSTLRRDLSEQFVGMRTLFLKECKVEKAALLDAFSMGYEALLIEGDLEQAIKMVMEAIEEGLIMESDLDKRILKILAIKAYFQI